MHLRRSRKAVESSQKKLWLATACLGLVTGCTILQPIQTQQADRRFALNKDANASKNIPCTPVSADQASECKPLEEDIDAFHGGLGRALWETDVRRRALLAQAADHTNLNSAYNALLWPLGAYVIERKIRRPEWRTLDVAALAAASYGLLSSGIPERDLLYVRTAARMACSITLFDADLYLKKDITPQSAGWLGDEANRAPATPSSESFSKMLDGLAQATKNFAAEREDVLLNLKLQKQSVPATGVNPADKARLAAKGLVTAPKTQKDPTRDFIMETDSLLSKAQAQLQAARKLQQQLDDAGNRLRRQRIAIESALTQALNERTPTLQTPGAVATQIAQAFEAGMASERKFVQRVNQQSGSARSEDWLPTPAALADLDQNARDSVLRFWSGPRKFLKAKMADMADWTARHDERVRLAKADASSMGCTDGDLAEFTRSLSKAAEGGGTGAATPPTPAASK